MAENNYTIADEHGEYDDWIELHNASEDEIQLEGIYLSDDPKDLYKFRLFLSENSQKVLKPGEYLFLWADGDTEQGNMHCNFKLDSDGEHIYLIDRDGTTFLDHIAYNKQFVDISFGRVTTDDTKWAALATPTPMAENERIIYNADSVKKALGYGLVINEILSVNNSSNNDEYDEYDDWIELYNNSDDDIKLEGMYLSDDPEILTKYRVKIEGGEKLVLKPGEFVLFWADEDTIQGEYHCNFKLSSNGDQLFLVAYDGRTVLDKINLEQQKGDVSFGRYPDGSSEWVSHQAPTPGESNLPQRKADIAPPEFSAHAGFYTGSVTVALTATSDSSIVYYSLDGSDPAVETGIKYSKPVRLMETTVLRARTFHFDQRSSEIVTNTYFVNENVTLPVVSLVTNPPNLWDWDTGIYVKGDGAEEKYPYFGANFHEKWEKSGHFEFFNTQTKDYIKNDIVLKLSGNYSRGHKKKSFKIRTESKNGKDYFSYPFFKDKPNISKLSSLILRSDGGSGWHVKNELIYQLNKAHQSSVSVQSYQPTVLFLNGEYWGIYNLMETKGSEFIETNYSCSDADIISYTGSVVDGDYNAYRSLITYLRKTDLSNKSEYHEIDNLIDVDNFIDYWFYEIYTGKGDNGNIRYWRKRSPGAKWRWISYDMDSWAHRNNVERLTKDTTAYGYMICGPLLRNPVFREKFIQRFADLLNFTFSKSAVQNEIADICHVIKDEISRDILRWGFKNRSKNIDWMKDFAEKRPDSLREHMIKRFSLNGTCLLQIDLKDTNKGTVTINTHKIGESGLWEGVYFSGFPISLSAVPKSGYNFDGWNHELLNDSTDVTVTPYETIRLKPVFSSPFEKENKEREENYGIKIASRTDGVLIQYSFSNTTQIDFKVYDMKGVLVHKQNFRTAADSEKDVLFWNGFDGNRKHLAKGIYVYQLTMNGRTVDGNNFYVGTVNISY